MSARIAVVEDEKDIQSLIVEELEDEGYEVRTANNGREGLAMIQEYKPHLILSDITMPELDGYGMLKSLRELKAYRSTPVVFLSALADRRHIIEGKRMGVDDYVTKPIDFELLLATLEARIREVERMAEEKEEQMVKLYNSFMAKPEMANKPKPALIVAHEWMDIESIHDGLKALGVPFITHHRGSKLDDYLKDKQYSMVILAQQTSDTAAKIAAAKSRYFKDLTVPRFLLIDNSKDPQDMSFWERFTSVISMDTATNKTVAELFRDYV